MTGGLKVTYDASIALLEMSEPASRNALSEQMRADFIRAMEDLHQKTDLRAVVLTGSGGVFSSGGDLKAMLARHRAGETSGAEDVIGRMAQLHGWIRRLRDLPVPLICAIDGPAFGAGFGLACAGDILLASDRASFGASFCKVGAVPDGNLFYTLPRIVGLQRAKELFYTGRTVLAEEALRLGLVMEVMAPEALLPRAMEMARMMCDTSPTAFRLTKQIASKALELDDEALLAMEAQAQSICLSSHYHREAIQRFSDKQPPKFDFR
tara:strand:+ start:440 stop:1237 length:798 start_codon:yes stop_codon:yes gene_type:complete